MQREERHKMVQYGTMEDYGDNKLKMSRIFFNFNKYKILKKKSSQLKNSLFIQRWNITSLYINGEQYVRRVDVYRASASETETRTSVSERNRDENERQRVCVCTFV